MFVYVLILCSQSLYPTTFWSGAAITILWNKWQLRVDLTGDQTQKVFDRIVTNLGRTAPPVPGFRMQKGGKNQEAAFFIKIDAVPSLILNNSIVYPSFKIYPQELLEHKALAFVLKHFLFQSKYLFLDVDMILHVMHFPVDHSSVL